MAEGFLPVDQHEGSQQRDGDCEHNDADCGGQVERGCCKEGLRHEHAHGDQCAVDDVVLPEPFLLKL
jgi:hypothetical protein